MARGIKTVIYPTNDIGRAKTTLKALLGVEPYADQPYYVGFKVGDQDIGLDPHGHAHGATPYFHVDDIAARLQALRDAGATVIQEPKDVGGGKRTAVAKDADGNIIGLIQGS
jgi:predicted enzyme related to lactoylglutathione lyase